ncbi:hypothetical protein cyc_08139 [Cyclospora cayetanensis]|uniref:Uncharacterized protein n=1 Tax=Cyclospora cayetanensis TaxID=88456 RepID=A0A1D3D8P8_9EIME|nr:hypothetical protein cyc_08139 [Cyclospora cayetanensis]
MAELIIALIVTLGAGALVAGEKSENAPPPSMETLSSSGMCQRISSCTFLDGSWASEVRERSVASGVALSTLSANMGLKKRLNADTSGLPVLPTPAANPSLLPEPYKVEFSALVSYILLKALVAAFEAPKESQQSSVDTLSVSPLPEELVQRDEARQPESEGPQFGHAKNFDLRALIPAGYFHQNDPTCYSESVFCEQEGAIFGFPGHNSPQALCDTSLSDSALLFGGVLGCEASLDSLTTALKKHVFNLISAQKKAATAHKGLLMRSTKAWFSLVRSRLTADFGSLCFMHPITRRGTQLSGTLQLQRIHGNAKLSQLIECKQIDQGSSSTKPTFPLEAASVGPTVPTDRGHEQASEQEAQNIFGLCRMPDLPVDDIHIMQAVDRIHRRLNDPSLPMLRYVPPTLPQESEETIMEIVASTANSALSGSPDLASYDDCANHISQKLNELENLHSLELWHMAESSKPINSELLLRSMVKFAHFALRDIAPVKAIEYRGSLLKLANKWSRTTELIREFNQAILTCSTAMLPPIYFPQYRSRALDMVRNPLNDLLSQLRTILALAIPPIHRLLIGGAFVFSWTLNDRRLPEEAGQKDVSDFVTGISQQMVGTSEKILGIALDPQVKWVLVRTLLVVPFWLFSFGSHCGPPDKRAAFNLGYGLCPYHMLPYFVEEALAQVVGSPGIGEQDRRSISLWLKGLELRTLPEKAGKHANVFLHQQIQDLVLQWPHSFQMEKGKVFKVFPPQTALVSVTLEPLAASKAAGR